MNSTTTLTNESLIRRPMLVIMVVLLNLGNAAWCADPLDDWRVSANPFPGGTLQVAFGNDVFVAMRSRGDSGEGLVTTSSNGADWARQLPPVSIREYVPQLSFLRGTFFSTEPYMTSSDGVNWTNHIGLHPQRLAFGNEVFVGIDTGVILVSSNGLNWVINSSSQSFAPSAVTFGSGLFVIAGQFAGDGVILSSPDGRGWTFRRQVYREQYYESSSIVFGNGRFVISGDFGTSPSGARTNLITSINGFDWNPVVGPQTLKGSSLAFDSGVFLASAYWSDPPSSIILSSLDGATWTEHQVGGNYVGSDSFAFGKGTFVGVGYSQFVQSAPLTNGPPTSPPALAVNSYAGLTVTGSVGRVYAIEVSTDLSATNSWQPLTNLTLITSPQLWVDPQSATTPKRFYRAVLR